MSLDIRECFWVGDFDLTDRFFTVDPFHVRHLFVASNPEITRDALSFGWWVKKSSKTAVELALKGIRLRDRHLDQEYLIDHYSFTPPKHNNQLLPINKC